MSKSYIEKSIPVLDDLIVPGKTNRTPHKPDSAPEKPKINPDSHHLEDNSPVQNNSRSAFEATVEAIVTEILHRHMENARIEITHRVLTELRSRLSVNSNSR